MNIKQASDRSVVVFLAVVFLSIYRLSYSQQPELNSFSELPVLNYSTELFRTGDSGLVNTWIRNTAASELSFTDSILSNFKVKDKRSEGELLRRKIYCEFITGNWEKLKHSDTILLKSSPFGIERFSDLASFAKSALQSASGKGDINTLFISYFNESLKDMSSDEKAKHTGSVLGRISRSENIYDKELKRISQMSAAADTSLMRLFQAYVYIKLGNIIRTDLERYSLSNIFDNFTRSDSLRGTLSPERSWWDVLRYDISIKPDAEEKSIAGVNEIKYKVVKSDHPLIMQIDLQKPMKIDSIYLNDRRMDFKSDGNAWFIPVSPQKRSSVNSLKVYFHGIPHEAVYPPWDGGWIWRKDSLGNPWMSVACQGIGASLWYPCKEHQSDEPDEGASLTMTVRETLTAVSNGRLKNKTVNNDGTATFKWEVVNPINNYNIVPYIGKYVNLKDVYSGEKGKLDIDLWVLDYNLERAEKHMIPEVKRMLKAFEYWMGPYPFYEDGYKLVEAPHAGMEHQSAVAYGNKFQNGFWGMDGSGTGWGMKWDYILVHESGHEWFGNNITSKDIADMWVQEGFTTYSEVLFTEYWFGKKAGEEYNAGIRKAIQNNFPLIGFYGVNDLLDSRSSDMYQKGANLLHSIRNSMDDDDKFRQILRGLNETFYHRTVTSAQIENFISGNAEFDYSKVFDQYLRTVQIPVFEYYFDNEKKNVFYRYTNCLPGFDLPLVLKNKNVEIKIYPSGKWNNTEVSIDQAGLFNEKILENKYYIYVKELKGKH